jgi:hypothetical protein
MRNKIAMKGKLKLSIVKEVTDTLNYLGNLEQESGSLKADTHRLQLVCNELDNEYKDFESRYT